MFNSGGLQLSINVLPFLLSLVIGSFLYAYIRTNQCDAFPQFTVRGGCCFVVILSRSTSVHS